jgi:2-aminomuconate deaminase
MGMTGTITSKRAPDPVGPYPHARRVGDFIFVSGMGPRQAGTNEIPGVTMDGEGRLKSHDIEIQTRAAIKNVQAVLEDMGASLEDVVDVSAYLTNLKADFRHFNEVYGEYFSKIAPTRTTVEVTALPTPIAVELKVIAYRRA